VTALTCSSAAFAQTSPAGEERIIEPITINGQSAQGVMVIQNGAIQTYTCPSPQPYTTANQSESGWACFEQTTGIWLLHAQPPLQTTYAYQQPQVYVQASPTPVYSYYSYPYDYYPYGSYYPYTSRFIVGPRFGFGFGLGFGHRAPIIVNRPFIRGPVFRGRALRGPVLRGPIAPFVRSRPFVQTRPFVQARPFSGSRAFVGSPSFAGSRQARAGMGFGRGGRR
jgi:hypothetical protein